MGWVRVTISLYGRDVAIVGIFKHKRNDDEDAEVAEGAAEEQAEPKGRFGRDKAPKQKRQKKNDMLASVVRESVVDSVLTEMRANPKFTTTRNGIVTHVGWMLDCDTIGGLSKSAARADEDKGAIIECISAERIKVLVTPALMDNNRIVLIPDEATLDAASEFSILANATYELLFVEDDGRKMDTDGSKEVTFDDALSVSHGDITIQELLVRLGVEWASSISDASADATGVIGAVPTFDGGSDVTTVMPAVGIKPQVPGMSNNPNAMVVDEDEDSYIVDEDEAQQPPSVSQAPAAAPVGDIDLGDIDEPDVSMAPGEAGYVTTQEQAFADDVTRQAQQSQIGRDAAPAPAEAPVEAPASVITPEHMREVVRRTFYSNELGIDVPMDAFDAQFVANNDLVLFDENRPSDVWLNNYLNQQASEANADMRRMHESHIYQLRDLYQRLVAQCIVQINDLMDDTNPQKPYGKRAQEYRRHYEAQREDIDMVAQDRARVIRDDYEAAVRRAGESAARQAEKTYRDRHGREVEAKVGNVHMAIQRELKVELSDSMQQLSADRREEASKRLDLGVTTILARLSAEYAKMRAIEDVRYDEHRAEMAAYVDDNRANDIAWANSIDRDLENHDKAEAVRAEYTARMETQQQDYEARIASLKDDITQLEERNRRALSDKDGEYHSTVESLKADKVILQNKIDDMTDRIASIDDEKGKQYESRLLSAYADRDAANERYNTMLEREKKAQVVWIALAVVAVVAAVLLGMILGLNQRIAYDQAQASSFIDMMVWLLG